ncbi:MAG: hypothetical protein GTO22_02240, partial [Gemmatimonadales bacterium]|nr:hypothetical protein [Gemmatimonadales bacterium]
GAAGTVIPGTVVVTVEDPLDRTNPGVMEGATDQVFTDSGDGSLLNAAGVPVGSIDYVNGRVSFNASLRDSDESPVDFTVAFDTVASQSPNAAANDLVVDDGVLFSVNGYNPAGL